MSSPAIRLCDERECADLEAFLVERIVESNAQATGYFDARTLGGSVQDDAGAIVAGFNGHTWGGCGVVAHLWVRESHRGQGLGRALMRAAEAEAERRGCVQMVLSTHSFQAPAFYERLGYRREAIVHDQPLGHANVTYVRRLRNAP